MDLSGRKLADKYHLVRLLGRGGFGAVYLAVQQPLGRHVAVKTILPSSRAAHDNINARFSREARVLGRLRHANNTTLLDYGETPDGLLFMVQEFIDGRTLKAELKQRGLLEAHRAIRIACALLAGLDEAHHLGVIHRDIKPANVMLVDDFAGREQVKLLDFGIAKLLEEDDDVARTTTGLIVGTPNYMAPEQIRLEPVSPATDLYAVGALLHTMLLGRPPFDGLDRFDLYRRETLPPLPLRGLPAALADVIRTALASDPHARYPSARSMEDALYDALDAPDTLSTLELPPGALLALHPRAPESATARARPESAITDVRPEPSATAPDPAAAETAPARGPTPAPAPVEPPGWAPDPPEPPTAVTPPGSRVTTRLVRQPDPPAGGWPSLMGAPPPRPVGRSRWPAVAVILICLAAIGFGAAALPGIGPEADEADEGVVRITLRTRPSPTDAGSPGDGALDEQRPPPERDRADRRAP